MRSASDRAGTWVPSSGTSVAKQQLCKERGGDDLRLAEEVGKENPDSATTSGKPTYASKSPASSRRFASRSCLRVLEQVPCLDPVLCEDRRRRSLADR